ncbi:endoribonuclease Dicer isoform X2 [Anthonomus grandis grandis]|uniref:endoribonuclease Dicer isoform X2 n=1 Tax=Anthonomus grandis grandis TaxID=2921223 RepID=UPI002165D18E|nr:endoribonuclease Dicer isoform X2 [Anthonomus grandis grandis]
MEVDDDDFPPRDYQVALMEIARKENTIIYLPTGAGKTFIAILVLKSLQGSERKYSEGGKISFFLVNTVALVEQHAKCLEKRTNLNVGRFSGDMGTDFWPRTKWYAEFDKYQVLVMTCQILLNVVNQNFLDLNKVNLLVFDECHRGVNDHSMRQVCKSTQHLKEKPRILGLTATLLNGNCKPDKVMKLVQELEISYLSKVATVDGLSKVAGFSTNPIEIIRTFKPSKLSLQGAKGLANIELLIETLKVIKTPENKFINQVLLVKQGLTPISKTEGLKKLANCIKDIIYNIQMMGLYGGTKVILAHLIQIERLKKHCNDSFLYETLNYVQTALIGVNRTYLKEMDGFTEEEKIFKFSSPKILLLLEVLDEYIRSRPKSELCALIFTQRRFTAKVVYYILKSLSESSATYSHIKPNFMVGFNCNPYNDTRENLYSSKINRKVLQSFDNKEINVLCSSNVLEEGVDITMCSLVIKFDSPDEYRSYIQSKGRARNPTSLFYMLVPEEEASRFNVKYRQFKAIENTLEQYLIGKNEWRQGPTKQQIEEMYNEDEIKPYYVNGLNSAKVDMISAISLLSQYCNSLSCDKFTCLSPEYFLIDRRGQKFAYQVEVRLPVKCPLIESIIGPEMGSQKSAKRAAALYACIKLHQIGELDEHLLPKKNILEPETIDFLFTHYPVVKEPIAGTNKNRRLHKLQIPQCLKGSLIPNKPVWLHVIDLQPDFVEPVNLNDSTLYQMYKSNQTYGLITPNEVPSVCEFPIYTAFGAINVKLQLNVSNVLLNQEELHNIREFNVVILGDVLNGLKPFIIIDNGEEAENMLFVPINKEMKMIDFDVLKENKTVRPSWVSLTSEERLTLTVTNESHLHKVVSPWYRDMGEYLVTEVTLTKTAKSQFPNDMFESYEEYYKEKHNISLLNPTLPLLYVTSLTKRTNFFKPQGTQNKRKKNFDKMEIHLIPELVIKQEFSAPLWIQANLLPTIISRLSYLFRLEEFRVKMVKEIKIGDEFVPIKKPLELDPHHITYDPQIRGFQTPNMLDAFDQNPSTTKTHIKENYAKKMLENEYPWKDSDEPKDVERDLTASILDIEYYEKFLSQKMSEVNLTPTTAPSQNIEMKAITFFKDYKFIPIKRLETSNISVGPELNLIYKAMATIKANDIVNMERLETLGDSFLKYIASLYIYLRFPTFNEGSATTLKGRLVSNKNLFYLGVRKNIGGIMKVKDLELASWLPPGFKIPDLIEERINKHETSLASLYKIEIPLEQQISGVISEETIKTIRNATTAVDPSEDGLVQDVAEYFKSNFIGDKNVADCVEALLGAYIETCGIIGGIRFVEWMNIIPPSENLLHLLQMPLKSPIIDPTKFDKDIDFHLRDRAKVEEILGYEFKNKGYLLQALTHASYTPNRTTLSYERLEFLGDAILDFLITCYIFESCGNLSPGEITDLRSALVNNNTFASLIVRHNLHKYLLMINIKLQGMVDRFADYLLAKNDMIDEEVLILLEEKDTEGLNLAEFVDVPKVLGDVFEAIAGAIYLDSGKDLEVVWKVFHRLMWREIVQFSANVPKNLIRRLYEYMPNAYPEFGSPEQIDSETVMIPLQFMIEGRRQQVFGFGSNKQLAKKAAAKLALRQLN